ncbi:hypothetical protein O6H91_10G070900 [Diphasiastrum complanatum]|uniref:Uncharacterized protein n=1 Tax=Diphasiastrum complanatum TaxID=34168 RepID=A0ACC2CII0_DIPCM|nr:hypothetical protein O6H91_10G070900 [Diphasiastrum complanatum]
MARTSVCKPIIPFIILGFAVMALVSSSEALRVPKDIQDSSHYSNLFGLEENDLSFEQQQQVMDMRSLLDAASRHLLEQDPYHT